MIDWPSDTTIITRLQVRGSGLDPLTARLRAANLLNPLTLQPSALPTAAILCIRSLRDPRPGALDLRGGGKRPMAAQLRRNDWEQAVIHAIDQLARHAARPLDGAVPANAEAVLFADRAELLACLAADGLSGSITAHWWWHSLLRGTTGARALLETWLQTPEYIPAALHHLAIQQQAAPFAQQFSETEVRTLLQAILRAFGLTKLHDALNIPSERAAAPAVTQTPRPAPSTRSALSPPAPWQHWLPKIDRAGLRRDQHTLLGIGLMLHRAPSIVRASTFARAVADWYRAAATPGREPAPSAIDAAQRVTSPAVEAPRDRPRPHVEPERPASANAVTPQRGEPAADERPPAYPAETPSIAPPLPPMDIVRPVRVDPASTGHAETRPAPPLNESARAETASVESPRVDLIEPEREGVSSRSAAQPVTEREAIGADVTAAIDTEYGGVFYLINLGLFLNLYGDFTTPLSPGLALPIWDFAALVARELIGPAVESDPVWNLLARLAGRAADEPPGSTFDAPGEWRIPIEWLAPCGDQAEWTWSADDDRLRVTHPLGFAVLDVRRDASDSSAQLQGELKLLLGLTPGPSPDDDTAVVRSPKGCLRKGEMAAPPLLKSVFDFRRGGRGVRPVAPLGRWLNWLMPYLRCRLQRALGIDQADVARVLCAHRAHILITTAHLDVYLSLADLPIEIRLAGLDRDPGWVPAAGRCLAFHFD